MSGLRCLSLHQPWASLVAEHVKTIETRSWSTKHRGRIGIASTRRKPISGVLGSFYWEPVGRHWELADREDETTIMSLGALVATATLVDCIPIVDNPGRDGAIWQAPTRSARYLWRGLPKYLPDDITDQLPYGDFTPGRWAWLLDEVKPTTERCPACWGAAPRAAPGVCVDIDGDWWHTPGSCKYCTDACKVCIGGTRRVDPIPVKGHQGLWTWAP